MDSSLGGSRFTALILAAGKGKRIRELTDQPKCLLDFMGETLLARHLRIWRDVGIRDVVLVVGYKADLLLECVEPWRGHFNFTIVENEDPENLGNTVSLSLGLEKCKGPVVVFDADLVYETELLASFLQNGVESEILVGEAELTDIECAKTLVDKSGFARKTVDKRAVSEAELAQYDFAGEAIGILKFSAHDLIALRASAEAFLSVKQNLPLNWEHLMNEFLLKREVRVAYFDPKLNWMEIDTPEDYEEALNLFSTSGVKS